MIFKVLLLSFTVFFSSFAAGNYKPVRGLEPKERALEEEGTKEITIRRREVVKRNQYYEDSSKKFLNSNHFCDNNEMCRYFTFSYINSFKTGVSSDFDLKDNLGFAAPISGRRFGGDFFFGGKPFNTNYIDILFGVNYDMAYFTAIYTPDGLNLEKEYAMHAVAPSVRIMIDFFPEYKLSFYIGGEVGLAILDLVRDADYSVKYSYKIAGISQIGYKFGERNTFELFVGYRAFFVPEVTFDLQDEKVKTSFSGHGIQTGLKIKF